MSDTLSWLWDREVGKIDEWIFQPLPALFFKVDVLEFTIMEGGKPITWSVATFHE